MKTEGLTKAQINAVNKLCDFERNAHWGFTWGFISESEYNKILERIKKKTKQHLADRGIEIVETMEENDG